MRSTSPLLAPRVPDRQTGLEKLTSSASRDQTGGSMSSKYVSDPARYNGDPALLYPVQQVATSCRSLHPSTAIAPPPQPTLAEFGARIGARSTVQPQTGVGSSCGAANKSLGQGTDAAVPALEASWAQAAHTWCTYWHKWQKWVSAATRLGIYTSRHHTMCAAQ